MQENFETQLDLTPHDFDLRAIYADWLDENSYYDLAYIQRWLAKRKLSPYLRTTTLKNKEVKPDYKWAWYPNYVVGTIVKQDEVDKIKVAQLPQLIFINLPKSSEMHNSKYYPSRAEAENALLSAINKFKELISIS